MHMKHSAICVLCILLSFAASAQHLCVGTYNVRNQNDYDVTQGNGWQRRSITLCQQINFVQPDVFGTQEALSGQIADMLGLLDGYAYVGVGRDDGKRSGEYSAIFYKKSRVDLVDSGNFWISPTPDTPSLGWDAACIRICSWAEFQDKATGKHFFFFNLHMDHVGIVARREGAKLVVDQMSSIAGGNPAILTGDFNVDQTNEIYSIFTRQGALMDSYEAARLRFCENGTFNSFRPELKTTSRIDHVFLSHGWSVDRYGVLTNAYWKSDNEAVGSEQGHDAPAEISFQRYQLRCPSDHYPVFVYIDWSGR